MDHFETRTREYVDDESPEAEILDSLDELNYKVSKGRL